MTLPPAGQSRPGGPAPPVTGPTGKPASCAGDGRNRTHAVRVGASGPCFRPGPTPPAWGLADLTARGPVWRIADSPLRNLNGKWCDAGSLPLLLMIMKLVCVCAPSAK